MTEGSHQDSDDPAAEREAIPLDIAGNDDRERPDGGTGLVADSSPPSGTADGPSIETNAGGEETSEETDEPVEPVEVLVTMAEDGDIDPWDIDVVAVTDKFLARLDEADLRTSGRALFYASVLLRMKSDALLEDGDQQEPELGMEPEPFDAPLAEAPAGDPFSALEHEMDRRLERKRARGTPRTLDELVRELREAERDSWWKDSREYDTSDSPRGFQRGTQELDYRASDDFREASEPTAADVTAKTHGEDIDALRESVANKLEEHFQAGRDEVLFAEVEHAGGSRVETFLGLLFLSSGGRVRLRQDTVFGDLWIRNPDATPVEQPVASD